MRHSGKAMRAGLRLIFWTLVLLLAVLAGERISNFLSLIDVPVQKVPMRGTVTYLKHLPGEFLSAVRAESARHNENRV